MKEITLGLIPSPDIPENLINKISEQLVKSLQKEIKQQITWKLDIKTDVFVGAAEYVNETIEKVSKMKDEHTWDYALSITDLPSFSEHKVVIADLSTENGVGLISLPSFGIFPVKKRLIKAITHLVELLYKENEINIEDEKTTELNWDFLFSHIKRVTPEEDLKTDIRFILKSSIIGWLRVLTGMVLANKPWQALGGFKSILTLAFATSIYISIFQTPWELSVTYTFTRFILLMLLSIIGMTIWIIVAHNLWERATSKSQSQYRRLYNVTTAITLIVINVINYTVLFSLVALSIAFFVPKGIFEVATYDGTNNSIENYLRLAWFTTSLGFLVGAVGATVEKEAKIREITYSYRQMSRYYEIEEQGKSDDKQYGGKRQMHKESDEK